MALQSVAFKVGQIVKREDTGEQARVVEVLPIGLQVMYRVEYDPDGGGIDLQRAGTRSLLPPSKLRPCN